jgi:FKBP-type peptidyl-prolyl cis-trans isomerase (trigger factor)
MKVERPVATVGPTDIDYAGNSAQTQGALRRGDSPAQHGDRATVDFVGRIDGVGFRADAKGARSRLAGRMLPEFDAALTGMSVERHGHSRSFSRRSWQGTWRARPPNS